MEFRIISRDASISAPKPSTVYLKIDHWNDFSFVTMFYLSFCNEDGELDGIGSIRIGFKGQTSSESTYSQLDKSFTKLCSKFFSLGVDEPFYENLASYSDIVKKAILKPLNDIVFNNEIISTIREEEVFSTSLLRDTTLSEIKLGFQRVLNGLPALTDYDFAFVRDSTLDMAQIRLDFNVEKSSTPSTNIHAIIGRNGVGKTTLLNRMIDSIANTSDSSTTRFMDCERRKEQPIEADYLVA
ncbi:GTPase [Pseudoalteromonas sp. A601]|uniref:GTPase n=1 Tax=Pseudoalteromonas sp. A601 TaxID=1967839 RepID=UPI0020CB6E93|nr:GTPase [Pseudoalteromonas sp. A601]